MESLRAYEASYAVPEKYCIWYSFSAFRQTRCKPASTRARRDRKHYVSLSALAFLDAPTCGWKDEYVQAHELLIFRNENSNFEKNIKTGNKERL